MKLKKCENCKNDIFRQTITTLINIKIDKDGNEIYEDIDPFSYDDRAVIECTKCGEIIN